MLAVAFRRASPRRERGDIDARRALTVHGSAQAQAMELWKHVQGALVGVAGARIKEFIEELVPGFDEHYRRAERRASEPMITSRTTR